MPDQTVTPGRIVTYVLSELDAERINDDRDATGNVARAGDEYPAIVVRTWGSSQVNLQVFYDGNRTLWATSKDEGTGQGTWRSATRQA